MEKILDAGCSILDTCGWLSYSVVVTRLVSSFVCRSLDAAESGHYEFKVKSTFSEISKNISEQDPLLSQESKMRACVEETQNRTYVLYLILTVTFGDRPGASSDAEAMEDRKASEDKSLRVYAENQSVWLYVVVFVTC